MPEIERKKPTLDAAGKRIIKLRSSPGALRAPRLETMFEDDEDPLAGVDYDANDIQRSADGEISEVLRQIKERRKQQRERFRVARDTEYYFVVCFQCKDQKEQFLSEVGWANPDSRYLNGLELSRQLGVEIEPIELEPLKLRGKPKRYSKLEVL